VAKHITTTTTDSGNKPGRDRPVRVMVVDSDSGIGPQVAKCADGCSVDLFQVSCISEAFKRLNQERVDLAIIEANLPDGSGLSLAKRMHSGYAMTHTIIMTDEPSLDGAIEAMRIGAVDFIRKPLDPVEVKRRMDQAIDGLREDRQKHRRIRRLRRVCKKLNKARDEIAQQVDILCNDLVIAYQELAQQVQSLSQTTEFTGLIRQELDLETVLRRTLEYLLQKAGPTNAAIFLPANTDPDEYSLGGYVNYECTSESAEILMQHLADVLAPKMVQYNWPIHITDDQMMQQWLGQDISFLSDNHLLALPCQHEDDTLAVVVLFRHENQPFDTSLVKTCTSMAPLLAETLAKVVSIHHRLEPDLEDNDFQAG